eukprot:3839871-Prymnesium_polylepis.1
MWARPALTAPPPPLWGPRRAACPPPPATTARPAGHLVDLAVRRGDDERGGAQRALAQRRGGDALAVRHERARRLEEPPIE